MEAARVTVVIEAQGAEGAISALNNVGAAIDRLKGKATAVSTSLQNIGSSLMGIGTKMTAGVTLPIVAGFAKGVSASAKFEQQINLLDLVADDAARSFGSLRDVALTVGADIRLVGITSDQAAQGMTNLYKQGLTTADIFGDLGSYMAGTAELGGALRASIDLAAASELDLNEASTRVLETIKQFELPFTEASDVANTFVKVAAAGSSEVRSLSEGMQVFGPVAHRFGWEVEDAAIMLGLLEDAGIRGSEAGTMLRSVFTQMTSDVKPVVETLDALNVSLYDATTGQMKPAVDIIEELRVAMSNLTPEQENLALNAIADTRALTGLNILLGLGAEGFEDYADKVTAANDIQDYAAAYMDTFAGKMEQLTGSLEVLREKVVAPVMENFLTPLAEGVTSLVTALSAIPEDKLDFGAKIVAGLAGIGPALIALGGLTKLLGLAAAGIGALLSPVGLMVGAGIAIAVAWNPVTDMINDLVGTNIPDLAGVFTAIIEGAHGAAEALNEMFTAGDLAEIDTSGMNFGQKAALKLDLIALERMVEVKDNLMAEAIRLGFDPFDPAVQRARVDVEQDISELLARLPSEAWPRAMEIMGAEGFTGQLAEDMLQQVGDAVAQMGPQLPDVIGPQLAETLTMGPELPPEYGPQLAQGIIDNIQGALAEAGVDAGPVMDALFSPEAMAGAEFDPTALIDQVNAALSEVGAEGAAGIDLGPALATSLEGADLSGVANAINTALGTALEGADLTSIATSLNSALAALDLTEVGASIGTALATAISTAEIDFSGIESAISSAFAAIDLSAVGAEVMSTLTGALMEGIGAIQEAAAAAGQSLVAGIQASIAMAAAAAAGLAAAVQGAVGSIDLFAAGASAGKSLAAGLLSQVGAVAAAAAALAAAARGAGGGGGGGGGGSRGFISSRPTGSATVTTNVNLYMQDTGWRQPDREVVRQVQRYLNQQGRLAYY